MLESGLCWSIMTRGPRTLPLASSIPGPESHHACIRFQSAIGGMISPSRPNLKFRFVSEPSKPLRNSTPVSCAEFLDLARTALHASGANAQISVAIIQLKAYLQSNLKDIIYSTIHHTGFSCRRKFQSRLRTDQRPTRELKKVRKPECRKQELRLRCSPQLRAPC